ncbi:hypothetical protein L1887_34134 [Cichorium endivia]|nr:hypothetical protein L1887_34134 [Cichorium endivia]
MSSSQIRMARVEIHGRGRNRALRLDDGCRITEIGASPGDEIERLCESSTSVFAGVAGLVAGFPHNTTTAAIDGELEYTPVTVCRIRMRDSE